MPYRADHEAHRARCAALQVEIEELRRAATRLAETERQLAAREGELDELRRHGPRRAQPLLESLQVASPCDASWDAMTGDDRVRRCGACGKDVYDLSAMTRAEAEALVRAHDGRLCARMARRRDDTVVTSDCPVGARRKRVRRAVAIAAAAGGFAASSLAAASLGRVTMGAVVDVTRVSQRAIRAAAQVWRSEHVGECPTVETLRVDHAIDPAAKLEDRWGRPFTIRCEEDETTVLSAGRDGMEGTADDVVVPEPPARAP